MIKLSNSLLQKAKKTVTKKKTERRIPFPNEKKHRRGKVQRRNMYMLGSVSRRRHLNMQVKIASLCMSERLRESVCWSRLSEYLWREQS